MLALTAAAGYTCRAGYLCAVGARALHHTRSSRGGVTDLPPRMRARPLVDIETLERPLIVLKKNDETQYIVSLKIQRSRTRGSRRARRPRGRRAPRDATAAYERGKVDVARALHPISQRFA